MRRDRDRHATRQSLMATRPNNRLAATGCPGIPQRTGHPGSHGLAPGTRDGQATRHRQSRGRSVALSLVPQRHVGAQDTRQSHGGLPLRSQHYSTPTSSVERGSSERPWPSGRPPSAPPEGAPRCRPPDRCCVPVLVVKRRVVVRLWGRTTRCDGVCCTAATSHPCCGGLPVATDRSREAHCAALAGLDGTGFDTRLGATDARTGPGTRPAHEGSTQRDHQLPAPAAGLQCHGGGPAPPADPGRAAGRLRPPGASTWSHRA